MPNGPFPGVSTTIVPTIAERPLTYQRSPGDIVVDQTGRAWILEVVNGLPQWLPFGGGGTTAFSAITVSGAGPHAIPANTDVVFVDPLGVTAALQLVASGAQDLGRSLRIVQSGEGRVGFTSPSPLFTQSAVYELAHLGDSVQITPDASQWTLTAAWGAPRNFEVYVSLTGNDDALGTLADPLASVQEALRRAAQTGWREGMRVYVQPGVGYQMGASLSVPGGSSPQAEPATIEGVLEVFASGSVTAWTPGSPTVGTPITFTSPGPFVAGALRGMVLEMTSGALSGRRYGVYENTAGGFTLMNFSTDAAAPGDTFTIYRAPQFSDPFTSIQGATGSDLALRNIDWSAFFLLATTTQVQLDSVRVRTGGGFFENGSSLISLGGPYSLLLESLFGPAVFSIGVTNLFRWGTRNISVQVFGRNDITSLECITSGSSRWRIDTTGDIARLFCVDASLAAGTYYVDSFGGFVNLRDSQINNVVGDRAIHARAGGSLRLERVSGTGNVVGCVQASSGGVITVADPIVGTTISGGATPVQVGANAPTTWALIAGGLTMHTTDLAAAQSQLCRIGV